jgi:hypothetical protein
VIGTTCFSAAIADVRPWITTAVDPYMMAIWLEPGAGSSA